MQIIEKYYNPIYSYGDLSVCISWLYHVERGSVSGELPKIECDTFDSCSALERITFPNLSSSLEDIIQVGQVDMNKLQQHINQGEINWKKGDKIRIHVLVERSGWGLVKERVGRVVSWVRHDEREASWLGYN